MNTPKPRHHTWGPHSDGANGTWIEQEAFAYTHAGSMLRRCRARCSDGKLRIVRAGIPDTVWTIPACARIGRKYVSGYLTTADDGTIVFNVRNTQS